MKLGAGKKKAKARGSTAKPSVKKAISALNGIEKAEKIQEKIVVKKKAITERARSKNDETLIKRAESEEQAAIAVLERIRADKNRAETELKSITAGTAPKKDRLLRIAAAEPVSPNQKSNQIPRPYLSYPQKNKSRKTRENTEKSIPSLNLMRTLRSPRTFRPYTKFWRYNLRKAKRNC